MATGSDIITGAFNELGIHEAETAIEPDEVQLALTKLNDMFTEWDAAGRLVGFTALGSESDDVRIPRGMVNAAKVLLAARLAAPMKQKITTELAASIKAAHRGLLRQTVKIGAVKLPATLPKGSGNREYANLDSRFFDEQDTENF